MKFSPEKIKKVELHVHLDTCLSFQYMQKISPGIGLDEFHSTFIAPDRCRDLGDFISKIAPQIEILQTRKAITLAVDDLFQQLAADNVIYAEIRFAPLLHTVLGLTGEEIVETVISAIQHCSQLYSIEAGLLLCTLRHFTGPESMYTANLVLKYQGQGVVGLDLAADEAGSSLENHIEAFELVSHAGGNVIAHAGEACGAASIEETLDKLKVSRIGHGVRCIEDQRVIDRLIREEILLEICPSCNLVCNVFNTIEDHPVNLLKERGIRLNINTDARTVVNTTLNDEYQRLHDAFNWSTADFIRCNEHAIAASFIDNASKQRLLKKLTCSSECQ